MQPTVSKKRRTTLLRTTVFMLLTCLACNTMDQHVKERTTFHFYSYKISEQIQFKAHDGAEILFLCDSIVLKGTSKSRFASDSLQRSLQNEKYNNKRCRSQGFIDSMHMELDAMITHIDGVFVEAVPLPRYYKMRDPSMKTWQLSLVESDIIASLDDNLNP